MTDKQPEALQLADLLEESYPLEPEAEQSAAELRRQHQEIQELKKAKTELLEFAQRLGGIPCPLEVYEWLCKNNILDVRKAVIAKYKD